jgi:hypothetical protein
MSSRNRTPNEIPAPDVKRLAHNSSSNVPFNFHSLTHYLWPRVKFEGPELRVGAPVALEWEVLSGDGLKNLGTHQLLFQRGL